ncbi:MAG: phage portal protein, partial [Clostridia bacterium]|nr:phage portal protein [Clostridia bacterium]
RKQNPTIREYKKLINTLIGTKVEDVWSSNHKIISGFFNRFITQENHFLLANGVYFEKPANKEKLGYDFDMRLMEMGRYALVHKVSFGFFDKDRLRVFKFTEFVPLFDEENGGMRAGVRFWQIDETKPMRFTLYEEDGFTEYIKRKDKDPETLQEKRSYIQIVNHSEIDGTEVYNFSNYPKFPIIPMYGNIYHQSELVGHREAIDCYDLIKSGFANTVDDASVIYWVLKNSGGMTDIDLAKFKERIKMINVASVDSDEGGGAEAHTIDVPYEARERLLTRLEKDLYKDFGALDVEQIAAGNVTATQIEAAYDPLNEKVDGFESCVLDFLGKLFEVAGIEDEPKFSRSQISNQLETTQMVLMAAPYIDDNTLLSKLPWLTQEEINKILEEKDAEDVEKFETEGGEIDAEI